MIETKMKTDRAARLIDNALAELRLAADDLLSVRPSDASADAAYDIGRALKDSLPIVQVCKDSARLLDIEVQKR